MPRKEKAADGYYSDETKKKVRAMANSVNSAGLAGPESHPQQEAGPHDAGLEGLVRWASARNDGWVRIVPDVEGGAWWKWRFTSGRWAGHYVLYRQKAWETASEAFHGLAEKARSVDEGRLKASKDVF